MSSGAKASSNLVADPSGAFVKVLGLLSAKPFMSIAAVLLTLSRVVVSWAFAAAEYACALLYAMPVYVAAPLAVAAYLMLKKRAMTQKVVEEKNSVQKLAKAKAKAASIVSEELAQRPAHERQVGGTTRQRGTHEEDAGCEHCVRHNYRILLVVFVVLVVLFV